MVTLYLLVSVDGVSSLILLAVASIPQVFSAFYSARGESSRLSAPGSGLASVTQSGERNDVTQTNASLQRISGFEGLRDGVSVASLSRPKVHLQPRWAGWMLSLRRVLSAMRCALLHG